MIDNLSSAYNGLMFRFIYIMILYFEDLFDDLLNKNKIIRM